MVNNYRLLYRIRIDRYKKNNRRKGIRETSDLHHNIQREPTEGNETRSS